MNVLVVTTKPLTSLTHGYDLRVWHLCRELRDRGHVLVQLVVPVAMDVARTVADGSIEPESLFRVIRTVPAVDEREVSWRRHFRRNEIDFLRLGHPALFAEAERMILSSLKRDGADRVVFFGVNLAGLAARIENCRRIIDVCDSTVLTKERESSVEGGRASRIPVASAVELWRWRKAEGALSTIFDEVVAVSPADAGTLAKLSGRAVNISIIPNGVEPALIDWCARSSQQRRGVVFWGNLGFGPNREATRYFFEEVYRPRLRAAGIEWCVVGRNAEAWLQQCAQQDPNIRLTGFVRDMWPLIAEYPVMVNPMVSGSGLKNKVLEAFALGIAVVSTPMGVEAIEGGLSSVHFAVAQSPDAMTSEILRLLDDSGARAEMIRAARRLLQDRYTWRRIGDRWERLLMPDRV